MDDLISFEYSLPSGKKHIFSIERKKIFNVDYYRSTRELHNIYESNYLFIPDDVDDVVNFLNRKYDSGKIYHGLTEQLGLEDKTFGYIESLVDECDFRCSRAELSAFCKNIISEEMESMSSPVLDDTLQLISDSDNRKTHLINLIVQFAIEFLSEGSGMSSYVGGSFGEIQSNLFRIIQDEMGGGVYKNKHSHLYEGTMKSLQMSSNPKFYKDYYNISTYTVSNYIYNLCLNKQYYFRFLGSLFRNEACFINWQKQLSQLVSQVLGEEVDRRYFEVHSIVDQDHGNWAYDTIVDRAVEKYGDVVIPELLRGYFEYKLYQDINDFESRFSLKTFDALSTINSAIPKVKSQVFKQLPSKEKTYFIHHSDVVLDVASKAHLELIYDLSEIALDKDKYVIPAYFPVWITAEDNSVCLYEVV